MKRIIALAFCLLMAIFLTACVGNVTAGEDVTSAEQTETKKAASDTVESVDDFAEAESAEEESVEDEPAFDTGWAGAGSVMAIPEPPFAYEVNIDGNFVDIRSTNGGMDGDVTHQLILDYCEELKNVGFTIELSENEIGERYGRICYEFSANDAAGNHVNLIDDGGGVVILVEHGKSSDSTDSKESDPVDLSALGIPELPEGSWEKEQINENTFVMTIQDIDYKEIDSYIGTLNSENFAVVEIEPYSGTFCEVQAEKNIGSSSLTIVIQYGNNGTDCRIAVTEKNYG